MNQSPQKEPKSAQPGNEVVTQDQGEGRDPDMRDAVPRRRRLGVVVLAALGVLVLALAFGFLALMGRPVAVPVWLTERIESQLNQGLQGARIDLGDTTVVIEEGVVPRVRLRDVALRNDAGDTLINLSNLEGTLALRPLLSGQVRPSRIWLTEAQMTLTRRPDGSFNLALGGGDAMRQAENMGQLIEQIDRILVLPELASLKEISAEGLTLRYEDQRARRGWTVDGGRLTITREGGMLKLRGDVALLSGRANAATLEMNYASQIGSPEAEFGINFNDLHSADLASQAPVLAWLSSLKAPISGAIRGRSGEAGQLGTLSATLQIGKGVLQPLDETQPIPFDGARSYFSFDPKSQTMQFDEISVDSPWGKAKAEGRVRMGAIQNGLPNEFIAQMRVTEIAANPRGLYPQAVQMKDATMDLRLTLAPFRISLGEMTLRDGDSTAVIRGNARADKSGWTLSVNGRLDRITPARVLELWPETVKQRTRKWVAANVKAADLRNAQVGLRLVPGARPDVYLSFEFRDGVTRFMRTMPVLTGAKGHASLMRNRFLAVLDHGRVRADQGGSVDVAGTSFIVPDARIRQGPAQVNLRARGNITAALSLLNRKPLSTMDKAGQPVTLADGRVEATGRIDLLMKQKLPIEDLSYDIKARLTNVRSGKIVPGKILSAPVLSAHADKRFLTITGEGRVGQVPFRGKFTAPLDQKGKGVSRVEGRIALSNRFLDEFRIGLPKGSVRGNGWGDVRIALRKGKRPDFSLKSNLSGLRLAVAPVGWSKGAKARGVLEVSGQLGSPIRIPKLRFEAPGLRASGRIDLTAKGAFDKAVFDRVRVRRWLDAPVTIRNRGQRRPVGIDVAGGKLDLRLMDLGGGGGSTGGSSGGGPIKARLDRLTISEGISLTGFRGDFSTAKGMNGTFAGRVNGGAQVTGTVVPQNGRSAFRIRAKDAGGVMRSAGVLENAARGDLDMTLLPVKGEGHYDGRLKVKNVWLRDAPAMAELLNAISVVGLLEQLSGRGILFGQVEARFRLTPKQVIVAKSSAVGASMGISMDGIYDLASGQMNMQGVVSPFYMVNGIGSVLTRKGEGLIGFNYRLTGTGAKPKVRVNPLSLLTPGMFREIFRRRPPKLQ